MKVCLFEGVLKLQRFVFKRVCIFFISLMVFICVFVFDEMWFLFFKVKGFLQEEFDVRNDMVLLLREKIEFVLEGFVFINGWIVLILYINIRFDINVFGNIYINRFCFFMCFLLVMSFCLSG